MIQEFDKTGELKETHVRNISCWVLHFWDFRKLITSTLQSPTVDASSPSTTVPRDTGKAPAVETTVLGGISRMGTPRILAMALCTPVTGGSSSQPDPPETELETSYLHSTRPPMLIESTQLVVVVRCNTVLCW